MWVSINQMWLITSAWCEGCIWSRDTPGPISRPLRAENTELWLTSRVDLWSQKTIKNNNNIKQIRNKKLITEIWTETIIFLLLQLSTTFLNLDRPGFVTIRRLLTLFSLLISYKNQNQQCNKKVFNPSLGRRERRRGGGVWRRGKGGRR